MDFADSIALIAAALGTGEVPERVDAEAMIAEGQAMIASIEAQRHARAARTAAARRQGLEAWERAQQARESARDDAVAVAASCGWMWLDPPPVHIF